MYEVDFEQELIEARAEAKVAGFSLTLPEKIKSRLIASVRAGRGFPEGEEDLLARASAESYVSGIILSAGQGGVEWRGLDTYPELLRQSEVAINGYSRGLEFQRPGVPKNGQLAEKFDLQRALDNGNLVRGYRLGVVLGALRQAHISNISRYEIPQTDEKWEEFARAYNLYLFEKRIESLDPGVGYFGQRLAVGVMRHVPAGEIKALPLI